MKYRNKKTQIDGILFDSKHEGQRYCELKLLERAGEIRDLQLQVPFVLIPTQYEEREYLTPKRQIKRKRKVFVENAVKYIADFCYYDKDGKYIVEDAKGNKTKDYIIKRKLMLYIHGIKIKET